MGWIGKLVGGTIGFAIGGPLGAVAGAAFGHVFDKSEEGFDPQASPRLSHSQTAELTFFVAAFSMLAKLSKADGRVSPEEIDSIEKFMLYDLGLDPGSRKVAMDIFYAATDSQERFEDFAQQFYQQFNNQPQLLELMIDILIRVSLADGRISPQEERLIATAVGVFQFGESRYQTLKSKYVTTSDRFYAVLGCTPDDSHTHIKSQYRKLVREYHPDTIASKGLPEEFTKFAADKFREIQEAYEAVKRERGIG